ncbi:MAG: hypothetical protein IKQ04_10000 [Oscillospiraceae bacterium]|nr:hypothetical protein [Oscillospiraceae bacterium]
MDQHILTSVNDLSCEDWEKSCGRIYRGLIEDGAQTVMVGHIAQPAWQKHFNPPAPPDKLVPATLSPELLGRLLEQLPVFRLRCRPDAGAVSCLRAALEAELPKVPRAEA